jgi:hypothetical protein
MPNSTTTPSENRVVLIKRYGLDVYVVIFRGIMVGEFLSVASANTKLMTLANKLRS